MLTKPNPVRYQSHIINQLNAPCRILKGQRNLRFSYVTPPFYSNNGVLAVRICCVCTCESHINFSVKSFAHAFRLTKRVCAWNCRRLGLVGSQSKVLAKRDFSVKTQLIGWVYCGSNGVCAICDDDSLKRVINPINLQMVVIYFIRFFQRTANISIAVCNV